MTVLELFCGAGGAYQGLHAAGWDHAACIDYDEAPVSVLHRAGGPAEQGDLSQPETWADLGRRFRGVDALWSSFPCQAFSSAGKRAGASDERNGWPWTVGVMDAVRPTWVICENVRGLLMHSGEHCGDILRCPACYFHQVILVQLRERFASVQFAVIDSADHGVPQHRQRVYIVAGPRPIAWPSPTHGSPNASKQGGLFGSPLKPWRTVRDALGLLGRVQSGVCHTDSGTHSRPIDTTKPSPTLPVSSGIYHHPDVRINQDRGRGMVERHGERGGTLDQPLAGALRAGGRGGYVVIGGGRNPTADPRDRRTYRDLTDEPCTTIAAEQIGNAGPWIVDPKHPPAMLAGSQPERPDTWLETNRTRADGVRGEVSSIDAPCPALRGASGGSTRPLLVSRTLAGSQPERLDMPSPTVTTNEVKGSGEGGNPTKMQRAGDALFLATGRRRLTTSECRKLMAWAPEWDAHLAPLTKTARYRAIGNGCTPEPVASIARAVEQA
jgi:site-specific DNA-cytosine methylase